MNTKTCTRCKENKPRDLTNFPPHNKCKDGLDSWCRKCRASYRSEINRVTGEPTDVPSHDSSDAADALRTFFTGVKTYDDGIIGWQNGRRKIEPETDYDLFAW